MSNATASISNAAQTTGNFFSGLIKDYIGTTASVQSFTAVSSTTATGVSLKGEVQWDTTPLGLNYLTMSMAYSAPVSTFVAKTNTLLWFQVEKPVIAPAARLLQAATNTTTTNTTAAVVTGTGDFEGQALVFTGPDANFNTTSNLTKSNFDYAVVGKTSCVGDKLFYTTFCGKTATNTVAASFW